MVTTAIGLPISQLDPLEGSLKKDDLFPISQADSTDTYATKKATMADIQDAISSDIYQYTIDNLSTMTKPLSSLSSEIESIKKLIPGEASSEDNELADKEYVKEFVETSISSSEYVFKGIYVSKADLDKVEGVYNNYAFVSENDEGGKISSYSRYNYVDDDTKWNFLYKLDVGGFTKEQWAAINSGIDSEAVGRIPGEGKTVLTTDSLDGETIKYEGDMVKVGSIKTTQISDLSNVTNNIESRVKKSSVYPEALTFYLKDGTAKTLTVVLSS